MSSSVRRSLRSRKTVKLNGQIQCESCKRFYFTSEYIDESESTVKRICCNCEGEQQKQSFEKRQKKHGTIATEIKQELIKPSFQQNVSSNGKENASSVDNNLNSDCMVQIHSIEFESPSSTSIVQALKPRKIKKGTVVIAPNTAIEVKSIKALRNQNKIIQSNNEVDTKDEEVKKDECMINRNDTVDSLRQKFPKASPFEFEFLLFLKTSSK